VDIYTDDNFHREKNIIPLLLDPINNEIWVKGEKLDSKQIPTTVSAIKIVKTLLEKIGREVKNDKLPDSTYAEDRNEFQSKIISPLNKVLRQKLGKDLPLVIHGSLEEFHVKISSELPFAIHIVEKIF